MSRTREPADGAASSASSASSSFLAIPDDVRRHALASLVLLRRWRLVGGTPTGWARAEQLSRESHIRWNDARVMRAWFARHGPMAANGGTSARGYRAWLDAMEDAKRGRTYVRAHPRLWRGAVAWLLWGGDPALRWIANMPPAAFREHEDGTHAKRKRKTLKRLDEPDWKAVEAQGQRVIRRIVDRA